MCFSMGASFVAGAILLTIGYVAASQARTPAQYLLSAIPLLFSFQQSIEGLVWMALQDPHEAWRAPPLYIFLLLAQVVWPCFLPLAMWKIETDRLQKSLLAGLSVIGIITAACFAYGLLFYPVAADITHHHIRYTVDFPLLNRWYSGIPYLTAAVGAPLLSSNPRMRIAGLFLLASYIVSRMLYNDYLISVWCYFATAISLIICFDILHSNRVASREFI